MSSPTPPPQPRGFPAPCWTHDETVALIVAYREKWDSLGRRNLRSTDWEDIAASVSHQSASASDSTPKTSAQCRHKIEKLRRRFRAEKQRCANFKGRVFSSWDLFDLMASIEPTASEPVVASKSNQRKKNPRAAAEFDPSYDFDSDYGSKTLANVVLGLSAVNAAKSERKLDTAGSLGTKRGINAYEYDEDAIDAANQRAKLRHSRIARDFNFTHSPEDDEEEDDDDEIAYPVKSLGARNLVSPKLRPREYSRVATSDFNHYPDDDYQERSRFRSDNFNNRVENRAHLPGKSIRGIDSAIAVKVSSSIRLLVDELLQVEKMKMEMVKDIEKMRMRMEVKRSEMIIKSEQMIVSTLIEAIYDDDKNSPGKNSLSRITSP